MERIEKFQSAFYIKDLQLTLDGCNLIQIDLNASDKDILHLFELNMY